MQSKLAAMTKTQLGRLYNRLTIRMKDGMGYQPYGYDWSTLWATRPELAQAMRDTWSAYVQKEVDHA